MFNTYDKLCYYMMESRWLKSLIRLHVYRTPYPLLFQIFFHFWHCFMDLFQLLNQKFSVQVLNLAGNWITFFLDCDSPLIKFSNFLVLLEDQNFIFSEDSFNCFFDFCWVFVVGIDILEEARHNLNIFFVKFV